MGIAIKSLIKARLWTILLIVPMLAGCGYTSMALKPDTTLLDTRTKSVAIFTLTVKNAVNPEYGSAPYILKVESNKSGTTTFMLDGDWEDKGSPWNMLYADSTDFPVSLGLDAGKYTIRVLHGRGENLLLGWTFDFPLNTEFEVPPGSVVYLGHVVLTTREAKGDEPRAGGINSSLLDVAGYAKSTMDISITDQSTQDLPKFLAKYPCLKGMTIKTAIMTKK